MEKRLFTSESVTEGHPDKICDAVSDAVLDAMMAQDPMSRVACETCTTTGMVVVMGEITTKANVDIQNVVRTTLEEIGYTNADYGIDAKTCAVLVTLDKQSEDIALGVDKALEAKENTMTDTELDAIGAGDQGMMFGYATNETEEYMPYPIALAHKLAKKLTDVRKNGTLKYLRPDGKTQVTVEYEENKPRRIDTIIISTQHAKDKSLEELRKEIVDYVILPIVPNNLIDSNTKYLINHKGQFIIGGPAADTGLTGRKIIVDTYGGYARHGGGAFSGKDASKVDRSSAYMLRHIAKNIVANSLAEKCEIQVAYAIGMKEPLSIYINTFGTGKKSDNEIVNIIKEKFDLTPDGIIKYLGLRSPIYAKTTNYGHFGKNDLPWEKIIKFDI